MFTFFKLSCISLLFAVLSYAAFVFTEERGAWLGASK
jgi:hypothetical protein